jgi:hypothetical protein
MEHFISFNSSTIAKVGYDKSTSTLEIEFQSGDVYQYFDVPEHIWEAFKISSSKGKFFNDTVKGLYRYSKV